ncbi:sugar ABC transporter permease [Brevibacillus nitrificans]|uniref:carbohydrate ABC transporter permease n=1 Tax=Brevibacillus nitrificans TaxID=651560 RepID=UPI00285BD66D|nr:sugar ABC transporter permease [Brevibacillus nitrificans]MDR7314623.1 multiple sugar transport system permease protein [Brevibacillus nitrificans]
MKQTSLSEKQMGYLLILPAIVIILIIAIWPVMRSFWISLHDIRLNDPTKTEVHTSYGLDMERYVNTLPNLLRYLKKEADTAQGAAKEQLLSLRQQAEQMNATLQQTGEIAARYEKIDQLLLEFKPVPNELKYVELTSEQMESIQSTLAAIGTTLGEMGKQKQLSKPEGATGVVQGISSSVIEPNYVGFAYYKKFLTDSRMWGALYNTLFFTVVSVAIELVLGLWIALLINKQFAGRGLVRATVLIPWAIPTVISAMMWKYLYDGQNGIVAHLFEVTGLVSNMGVLLTTKAGAMFSVILADVWKTTPFMALLLFAGLQTIPQSLYEAAQVDGASRVQQFFRITLPMLKSTLLVSLLFRTLDAFRVFDLIYALTGGGPANSTETISILAYKTMFAQMSFGEGSALAVIVFLCVALISIGYIKILGADLLGESGGR